MGTTSLLLLLFFSVESMRILCTLYTSRTMYKFYTFQTLGTLYIFYKLYTLCTLQKTVLMSLKVCGDRIFVTIVFLGVESLHFIVFLLLYLCTFSLDILYRTVLMSWKVCGDCIWPPQGIVSSPSPIQSLSRANTSGKSFVF